MKDVAEFLRFMTPSLTDLQRYTYLSQFHLYSQLLLVCIFFMSNSFFSKLIILTIIFCCIYIEILHACVGANRRKDRAIGGITRLSSPGLVKHGLGAGIGSLY